MMTVAYCVNSATDEEGHVNPETLMALLIAREDNMADHLRLAGAQFGLLPWIVAEVVAELGLGTPLSDEERQMVRQNFVNGMEELRRQAEGQ